MPQLIPVSGYGHSSYADMKCLEGLSVFMVLVDETFSAVNVWLQSLD